MRAFEYLDVPADGTQEICGEQSAQRPADHQRAWLVHVGCSDLAAAALSSVDLETGRVDQLAPAGILGLDESRSVIRRGAYWNGPRRSEGELAGVCPRVSKKLLKI